MHSTQHTLERAKNQFMAKMSLISWKAAQWMQYQSYEFDEKTDMIIIKFKSSSYSIGFEVKEKAFSSLYGKPFLEYGEAYDFFRDIKYDECLRLPSSTDLEKWVLDKELEIIRKHACD